MGRKRIETGLVELNEAKDIGTSNYGVYAYVHLSSGRIGYVGEDSNIQKRSRHTVHLFKKNPTQLVDKVIQKSPEKWGYLVLNLCADEDAMGDTEKSLISSYKSRGMCWLNIKDVLNA